MSIILDLTASGHVGRNILLLYLYVPIRKVVGLGRVIDLSFLHKTMHGPSIIMIEIIFLKCMFRTLAEMKNTLRVCDIIMFWFPRNSILSAAIN